MVIDPTDEDVGHLQVFVIKHHHVIITENGAGESLERESQGLRTAAEHI